MRLAHRALSSAVIAALLATSFLGAAHAADLRLSRQALLDASEQRAVFGLNADLEYIQQIVSTGQGAGTDLFGIVLTSDEIQALDLPARNEHLFAVDKLVLREAQPSPAYAGAYVDQLNDGAVVVLLTAKDELIEASVSNEAALLDRPVKPEYVEHTFKSLETAMYAAWNLPELKGIKIASIGIDERANSLVIAVDSTSENDARDRLDAVADDLGVPVQLSADEMPRDADCQRNNCPPPMKAGILIYQGGNPPNEDAFCTMGFHVFNSAGQGHFLTAGHCGYTGSNSWYNPGVDFGSIGSESNTWYGPTFSPSRDVMSVHMPLSWMTNDIYPNPRQIKSMIAPTQGLFVCAARGKSSGAFACGTVNLASTTWTSNTCNCQQSGGQASDISLIVGVSGSPILALGNGSDAMAVGIGDTTVGNFAKVKAALDAYGYTIKTN